MASVTGMTAEAIDALFDAMVTSVRVDDNGQLIYKNKAGQETNAGPIVAPKIAVEKAWPVGSIFIASVPTNPNTLIGVGVWARFGQGRTLVSQYSSDADFDAAEETGGAKTVTLTSAQSGMPLHSHTFSGSGNTGYTNPNAQFTLSEASTNPDSDGAIKRGASTGRNTLDLAAANHRHTFAYSGTTSAASANAAAAHENMPPYIVVYVWKRTA